MYISKVSLALSKLKHKAMEEASKNNENGNDANTALPAVRLSMEEILRDAVRRQATYQVQFADYDLDTWTAPCRISENRMEKLLDDGSIRKVRLELEM